MSNGKKRHAGMFKPGQSGNPAGKPPGARNKATLAIEALLDGQAEALTQKAIDKALEGDTTAMRLCLERLCPQRKSRAVQLELPRVETAADIVTASDCVMKAMANGEITLDESEAIMQMLELKRRALETRDLEARIQQLESSAQ